VGGELNRDLILRAVALHATFDCNVVMIGVGITQLPHCLSKLIP
jgi:hypothetical protein